MNWNIDWGGEEVIFGIEFDAILAEGIEFGMDDLETLQQYGRHCDGCGQFRLTQLCDGEDATPTDRGTEFRFMAYHLCDECRREMFLAV